MPRIIRPDQIADPGLRLAVAATGSFNALARAIGIKAPSIMEWRRIPSHRILQIEALTGIDRERLRPDLYVRRKAKRVGVGR
jgi:DNA-binding transcriptional regulator YdaS (Cro superfamily)